MVEEGTRNLERKRDEARPVYESVGESFCVETGEEL